MSKGRPKGVKSRTFLKWSEEEKSYLKEICKGKSHQRIAELMQENFKRTFTRTQIDGALRRYNLKTGLTGYFEKGFTPWNKGIKGLEYEGSKETQFKKGHKSNNIRKTGSERVNVEGYTEIKINDPDVWELKHRYIYKRHKGEIPQGYLVIFADRDRTNFDINNLVLVSRKQQMLMNKNNLIKDDAELTKIGANLANLMLKIRERSKNE